MWNLGNSKGLREAAVYLGEPGTVGEDQIHYKFQCGKFIESKAKEFCENYWLLTLDSWNGVSYLPMSCHSYLRI